MQCRLLAGKAPHAPPGLDDDSSSRLAELPGWTWGLGRGKCCLRLLLLLLLLL
jgi:hypothetical protein